MYKTKEKKYNSDLDIAVIPIVTTPDFKMHPESVKSMKNYIGNMPKLFTMLAYQISC